MWWGSALVGLRPRWGRRLLWLASACLLFGPGCSTKSTLDQKLLQLIKALGSYSCANDPLELDLVPAAKLRLMSAVAQELGPLREPVMVGIDLQPRKNASTLFFGRYRLSSAKGLVQLELSLQNDLLSDFSLTGAAVGPLLARLSQDSHEDLIVKRGELTDAAGNPRASFAAKEAVSFHFRLAGLSTERCNARLRVGLTVLDRHGSLLLEQPGYRELKLRFLAGEAPVATFAGTLQGFAPGSYRLQFVLTDEVAQETVTHSLVAHVRR